MPREWVLASIDGPDTREGRGPDQQNTGFGAYGYLWQIDRPGARRFVAHQVATVGGVSVEAQQRRFLEGSPEVSESDIAALFAAIIAAHPEARTAFEER